MFRFIAALMSCLVIEGLSRGAGKAQCDASCTKCAEGTAKCDASDAKCGDSFLQRGEIHSIEDVKADEGTKGSSITHQACPVMDARHVSCGNQLNNMKDKGCPSDKIDCTAITDESCKQLCDANSGCKSFALRTGYGCQLCSSDGEETTESIGDSVYSQQCSASMTTAPTPMPPVACAVMDARHVTCGNQLNNMKDKGCPSDKIDCTAVTDESCKQLCDANSGCKSFALRTGYGCQLCSSDGEETTESIGDSVYSQQCSASMSTAPTPIPPLAPTPELSQQYYSKWMQELPGDITTGSTFVKLGSCASSWYNTKLKRHDAHAIGPQCNPPAEGFPGLIILPGKGGSKRRQIMIQKLFAGRGIVSMGVDMCYNGAVYVMNAAVVTIKLAISWMNSTTWDNIPYHGGLQFGVNPNDLSLMGYSAGAETINAMLYTTDQGVLDFRHKIANLISLCGVRGGHANNQDMDHLNSSWPNYIAIQADDDIPMGGAQNAVKFVSRLQGYGLNAFLIHYQTGGHHPFKPSMFYEVSLFIADPGSYQEAPYPLFNDGDISGVWEKLPNPAKACYGNLEPLRLMQSENWNGDNGRKICKYYCLQVEGCAGFDLLDPRAGFSDIGNANCMLYSEQCASPSRNSKQPSEFLQQPYVGIADLTYCRKEGNEFGYNYYDTLQCDGASTDIGSEIPGQTSTSCSKKCDETAECEGFQLGVLKDPVGKCYLKKDIVIENCAFHKHWMVYVRK